MSEIKAEAGHGSFLGTGWSFPPRIVPGVGALMASDEEDIAQSLRILFGTALGERFLHPKYGLDMRPALFEPMSVTMRSLLLDRIRTSILIYEPRIKLLDLDLDASGELDGRLLLTLSYEVRTTNSRFNLVHPFNLTDGSEPRP